MKYSPPSAKDYGVHHIIAEKGKSVFDVIKNNLRLEPEKIDFLLDLGSLYLNDKRIHNLDKEFSLSEGDYLRVHTEPRRFPLVQEIDKNIIVFEDDKICVVDKPAGIPVHPTVDNSKENLIVRLSEILTTPLYVTHRLDVGTSGLVILAKDKTAQSEINQCFADNKVEKNYLASVEGDFIPQGLPLKLIHYQEPSPRAPKKISINSNPGWNECHLNINNVTKVGDENLLSIELITGRTHQIRCQLSYIGHPICGDKMYGASLPSRRKLNNETSNTEIFDLACVGLKVVTPRQTYNISLPLTQFKSI